MDDNREYITAREYAEQKNISIQAVYKRMQSGKLDTMTKTENGKKVKYIIMAATDKSAQEPRSSAPELPEPPELSEAAQATQTAPDSARALNVLAAQLAAKDKQIDALTAQLAAVTDLLRVSQQLQAHSQMLLKQATDAENPPPIDPEPAAEPVKRNWLHRLFFDE